METRSKKICVDTCCEQHMLEVKKTFERKLIKYLCVAICTGFRSIYEESATLSRGTSDEHNNVLIFFKKLVAGIQNLSQLKIQQEYDRVKNMSGLAEVFDDLVRAVVKSNILLLSHGLTSDTITILRRDFHKNVNPSTFVHLCYVEASKHLHNVPETVQSNEDIETLVQNAIRDTIISIIPMKVLLQEYNAKEYLPVRNVVEHVVVEPSPPRPTPIHQPFHRPDDEDVASPRDEYRQRSEGIYSPRSYISSLSDRQTTSTERNIKTAMLPESDQVKDTQKLVNDLFHDEELLSEKTSETKNQNNSNVMFVIKPKSEKVQSDQHIDIVVPPVQNVQEVQDVQEVSAKSQKLATEGEAHDNMFTQDNTEAIREKIRDAISGSF